MSYIYNALLMVRFLLSRAGTRSTGSNRDHFPLSRLLSTRLADKQSKQHLVFRRSTIGTEMTLQSANEGYVLFIPDPKHELSHPRMGPTWRSMMLCTLSANLQYCELHRCVLPG